MKRILIGIAAVSCLGIGCTREAVQDGMPAAGVLRASAETPVRASFSDAGAFSWSAADAVAVLTDAGTRVLTLSDGAGSAVASFSGDLAGVRSATCAVSPATALKDAETVTLPSEYTFQEGVTNALMYAENVDLSKVNAFRHLGGLVKIVYEHIPAEADALVLTAEAKITGDFTISGGQIAAGTGSDRVTVHIPASSTPKAFYIPLPTGTYKFSVALQQGGRTIAGTEKATSSPKTIARRTLLLMDPLSGAVQYPEQRALVVDDGQIVLRWSNNGFTDIQADAAHSYTAGIYRDAACSDLLWSWTLPTTLFYWSSSTSNTRFQPGFVFPGLTPGGTYYIKVTDNTTGSSSVGKYVLEPDAAVDVTKIGKGAAQEGQVILHETFNEFWYGARSPECVPGYSSNTRSSATALSLPAGSDPAAASGNDLLLVAPNVHMGLFNTLGKYVPATRLKDWRAWVQNNLAGAMCVEAGCLKVGASNCTGDIVTPPLDCLRETATLKVTFDAAPYYEHKASKTYHDGLDCAVHVFHDAGTTVSSFWFDYAANTPVYEEVVPISEEVPFKTYSVVLKDVPAGARIGIGCMTDNTAGSSQHRCYLDNVRIELVAYGATPYTPETEINGSRIFDVNTAIGLVKDSQTGKGIPGVVVSDGYYCAKTDANGVYQFKLHSLARTVFVSIPSAYEVPLHSATHLPAFYTTKPLDASRQNRNDFTLKPLAAPETKFSMVMIGDPQCKNTSQVSRYVKETIPDIQKIAAVQASGAYPHLYAMTLGDNVSDTPNLWPNMKASMSNVRNGDGYIPFFITIGNHDHNATRPESDYEATTDFVANFGPTDYSFNRGDVHIISMDNVVGINSTGSTWKYNAGFSDLQYAWLQQDIALVPEKDRKMVFICCHIPFRGGATSGGSSVNRDKHYADVLNLLTQFKEAHIMIGHTHYPQNYIHTAYKCKGGQPVYEHIHQAACGAWWASNTCVTGGPNGYNLYEIDGPTIVNWVNKGTNRAAGYQLRVYDGNQTYTGTKGYVYNWYTASNVGPNNISSVGNAVLKNCFVAEVWDDDDRNVTVEFWQGGKKVANFNRLENGACANIAICSFWFNEKGKTTDTYASKTASHYWYYKPASGNPAAEKDWEVRVTRVIPSSGRSNLYSRSTLTTDYSEF